MHKIVIKEKEQGSGWLFEVEIGEDDSKSLHSVELFKEDYEKLTGGKIKPKELIEKSFNFLLKKEPKESILKKFNLMGIAQYFPEYEDEIKKRAT